MEEENRELKKQIADLESELEASLKREELLRSPVSGKKTIKEKIKATKLGKAATNPNTKAGKIVRSPKTVRYITRHPNLLKEILSKGKVLNPKSKCITAPVKFFLNNNDDTKRINLLVEKLDKDMLEKGIFLAKKTDSELRIITTLEPLVSIKYKNFIKELNLADLPPTSFYSSLDQNKKKDVFELEIGKNDVLLTKVWKEG